MTDRLSEDQLDRELRTFLAWESRDISGAPSARDVAVHISAHAGSRLILPRLAPQLGWILLAGLMLLALAGALLIGAGVLRNDARPVTRSYEAVFLRFDEGTPAPADVIVLGVNARGDERVIARLPEASHRYGWKTPIGVVSSTGLLALPASSGGDQIHWEIVDLEVPTAEPLAVPGIEEWAELLNRTPYYFDSHSYGPFWGPGERLAIPWSRMSEIVDSSFTLDVQVSFVEGRTGAATAVDVSADLGLLPVWASDGSGIAVQGGAPDIVEGRSVLRPDATVADQTSGLADGGYGRRYRPDGTEVRAARERIFAVPTEGNWEELLAPAEGEIVDVAWASDGRSVWIVRRSPTDPRDLTVDWMLPGSRPQLVSAIANPIPDDPEGRIQGHLMGLAPDDSMLVLTMDRITDNSGSPGYAGQLVTPATGTSLSVEGSFAGWLEVDR